MALSAPLLDPYSIGKTHMTTLQVAPIRRVQMSLPDGVAGTFYNVARPGSLPRSETCGYGHCLVVVRVRRIESVPGGRQREPCGV